MEKERQKIPRRPSHSPGNRDGYDCGLRPSSLRFHSDGEPVPPGACWISMASLGCRDARCATLSNCPMPGRKRKRRRTKRGGRNAPPGLGLCGRSSPCFETWVGIAMRSDVRWATHGPCGHAAMRPCAHAPMRPCRYVGLEGRRGIRRSPQVNVDDGPRSWSGDYKKHTESFLELSVDYIWATPVSRLTTWGDVAY